MFIFFTTYFKPPPYFPRLLIQANAAEHSAFLRYFQDLFKTLDKTVPGSFKILSNFYRPL